MVVGQHLAPAGGVHRQRVARRVDGFRAPLQQRDAVISGQLVEAERDAAQRQGAGDHQVGQDAGGVGRVGVDQRDVDVPAPQAQVLGYGGPAEAGADHDHPRCDGGVQYPGNGGERGGGAGQLEKMSSIQRAHGVFSGFQSSPLPGWVDR